MTDGQYQLTPEDEHDRAGAISSFGEAQKAYDKAVFMLSAGGITIAFTLVGAIGVKNIPVACVRWLICGLFAWGVSLIFLMISHYCAAQHADRYIAEIDKGNRINGYRNVFLPIVRVCNWVDGALFAIGFVLFSIFICTILYSSGVKETMEGDSMSEKPVVAFAKNGACCARPHPGATNNTCGRFGAIAARPHPAVSNQTTTTTSVGQSNK